MCRHDLFGAGPSYEATKWAFPATYLGVVVVRVVSVVPAELLDPGGDSGAGPRHAGAASGAGAQVVRHQRQGRWGGCRGRIGDRWWRRGHLRLRWEALRLAATCRA